MWMSVTVFGELLTRLVLVQFALRANINFQQVSSIHFRSRCPDLLGKGYDFGCQRSEKGQGISGCLNRRRHSISPKKKSFNSLSFSLMWGKKRENKCMRGLLNLMEWTRHKSEILCLTEGPCYAEIFILEAKTRVSSPFACFYYSHKENSNATFPHRPV